MQEDHFEAGELCDRKDRTVAGAENQPGQNPYVRSQSEGKRAGLLRVQLPIGLCAVRIPASVLANGAKQEAGTTGKSVRTRNDLQ